MHERAGKVSSHMHSRIDISRSLTRAAARLLGNGPIAQNQTIHGRARRHAPARAIRR